MSQTLTHQDSILSDEQHSEQNKKQKSRRPANTAFRQQRLKAWQPILTPKTVLPIFFITGIIFAPIGGLLLWASSTVQELSIDYTQCSTTAPESTTNFDTIPDNLVTHAFKTSEWTKPQWRRDVRDAQPRFSDVDMGVSQPNTPVCTIQFTLPNDIGGPVYLYYKLTNFYQNHRRYVKSLELSQLKGQAVGYDTIASSACNPLRTRDGKPIYPCGLIANSLFNDTIGSPKSVTSNNVYTMTTKGVAWQSDLELYGKTQYAAADVVPPPNWMNRYPGGYNDSDPKYGIPNLSEFEEFAVWMRTAGLPTFSKLSRRNDADVMQRGTYEIEIYDFFNVTLYGGTKSILLSTRTVMGGKNDFLGIAYIVVGGLCVILGFFFTVAHLIKPRKLGDHTYLSWNNDVPAATTSGRDTGR